MHVDVTNGEVVPMGASTTTWEVEVVVLIGNPRPVPPEIYEADDPIQAREEAGLPESRGDALMDAFIDLLSTPEPEGLGAVTRNDDGFASIGFRLPASTHAAAAAAATALAAEAFRVAGVDAQGLAVAVAPDHDTLEALLNPDEESPAK